MKAAGAVILSQLLALVPLLTLEMVGHIPHVDSFVAIPDDGPTPAPNCGFHPACLCDDDDMREVLCRGASFSAVPSNLPSSVIKL